MPSRTVLILLLLVCCIPVIGCNGGRETDEVAWIIDIGIDSASDGDLLVSYRVAVPLVLAAGEAGGGLKDKTPSITNTVKAPTLREARNLLNANLSRAVNLSHVTAIYIGEDLARAGVQNTIAELTRFHEFRASMFIFVCRGTAKEVLMNNKPDIEVLDSRWVENLIRTTNEASFMLPTNLHQFYTRLKAETGASYMMAIAINPPTQQEKRASDPVPGARAPGYLVGDTPTEGGNTVQVIGMGVFKEDKLVEYLSTEETRGIAILSDHYTRGFIAIDDPLLPQSFIELFLRNGRKPKIDVNLDGENPVINISIFLEGELSSVPSEIMYEQRDYRLLLETTLSNIICEELRRMLLHTQSLGTDILDFGYFIRPKFTTTQELVAYDWDRRFRQATFNVKVSTAIRRTGLLNKSSPIRREQ